MTHRLTIQPVQIMSLPRPISISEQLENAQITYANFGVELIRLTPIKQVSIEELKIIHIDACDEPPDNVMDPFDITVDQELLFDQREPNTESIIYLYFVEGLFLRRWDSLDAPLALAGCSAHLDGKPAAVLSLSASKWSVAHEIGHVLQLTHSPDYKDLMYTPTSGITANPPTLSDLDVEILKAHSLVEEIFA